MIIYLFILTFLVGLIFGYMLFHKNLRDITFKFKKDNKIYTLKYNKRVVEILYGYTKFDYVELEET